MRPILQKNTGGRPMLRTARPEGVYHSSPDGVMYLEPTPTRSRFEIVRDDLGIPLRNELGVVVEREVWVRTPWVRVTPKGQKPGAARRCQRYTERLLEEG